MADDAATVARLQAELRQLRERELAARAEIDALRQMLAAADARQTALANVLRVIASAPADLERVLSTVAESAARLCEAADVLVWRVDADAGVARLTTAYGPGPY